MERRMGHLAAFWCMFQLIFYVFWSSNMVTERGRAETQSSTDTGLLEADLSTV